MEKTQSYCSVASNLNWISGRLGREPRPALKARLSRFGNVLRQEKRAVAFLQLPTGYGKSRSTFLSFLKGVAEGDPLLGRRVVHVLPLRSIIHDLLKGVKQDAKRIGMDGLGIEGQMMGHPGSPFFAQQGVITTFDTFSMNLFKFPAFEAGKAFRYHTAHYELPRAFIYSGSVVLDEAHLFAQQREGERKQLTVFLTSVLNLACSGVPVLIVTATLPRKVREWLVGKLKRECIDSIDEPYKKGEDEEFEKNEGCREIVTRVVPEEDALTLALRALAEKKKVLAVFNEVPRAIRFKDNVLAESGKEQNLSKTSVLLHGRLVEREKKVVTEEMTSARLIVATQVVEAGVDLYADVLITDLAPMDRLTQRIGRVARGGGSGAVHVLDYQSPVYMSKDLRLARQILDKKGEDIDWVFEAAELVDDAYGSMELDDRLDIALFKLLTNIDSNLTYGLSDMERLLRKVSSLIRETGLIRAFASCYISGGVVESDGFVALEERKAREVLASSRKVVQNGKIIELEAPEIKRLLGEQNSDTVLSIKLEEMGIEGLVIEDYTPWVGYL